MHNIKQEAPNFCLHVNSDPVKFHVRSVKAVQCGDRELLVRPTELSGDVQDHFSSDGTSIRCALASGRDIWKSVLNGKTYRIIYVSIQKNRAGIYEYRTLKNYSSKESFGPSIQVFIIGFMGEGVAEINWKVLVVALK